MFYAIELDSNDNGIGVHVYIEEPATYPANEAPCTEAQAQTPMLWQRVNGALVESLLAAKTAQIAKITAAYEAAILAPVSYTTVAGTTAMFSTSAAAIEHLQGVIDEGSAAWTANLWLSNAGVPITPFTFADVQGLAAAIENVDIPKYHDLLKLISEVNAATTIAAVQSVTW